MEMPATGSGLHEMGVSLDCNTIETAVHRSVVFMNEPGSFVDRVLLRSCPPAGEEATALRPTTSSSLTSSVSTLEQADSAPTPDQVLLPDRGDAGECAATEAKGRPWRPSRQQAAAASPPAAAFCAEVGGSHERSTAEQAEAGLAAMGEARAMGLKKSGEDHRHHMHMQDPVALTL